MEVDLALIVGIIVSVLITFVVGLVWYSTKLFGNSWKKLTGITEESAQNASMAKAMGGSAVFALISSLSLVMFIGEEATIEFATLAGFLAGFTLVLPFFGINYLFEQKSMKLLLINGGYCVVTLTLMGLILGIAINA